MKKWEEEQRKKQYAQKLGRVKSTLSKYHIINNP